MVFAAVAAVLVLAAAAAWILLGQDQPTPTPVPRRADANPRTSPPLDSVIILADGARTADPRFLPLAGNPAALITVTEPDGRRGALLFGLGDPGSAAMEKNLALAASDQRLDLFSGQRAAVVFSHLHFNIFPKISPVAGAGRPPPRDLFPARLRPLGHVAVQGPNLASLCGLNRPSGHLMGSCSRKPLDTPVGIAPLQWSDGPSARVWLLTYPFSPPMKEELTSGIALIPLETVVIITTPPSGYVVFSFCSHMQAVPEGKHPARHAAYLVKAAMAAGKLKPGPVHTLITGTCDLRRTLANQQGPTTAGAMMVKMRADLGIKRLYLVHCGLTGDPAALGQSTLAYPGAVIPL